MNIGFFTRPTLSSILTAMFFIGIVISGGALYLLQHALPFPEIRQVYTVTGLTFLVGMLAVYFTARTKKQSVVYLDRQKDTVSESLNTGAADTTLDMNVFEKIIDAKEDITQKVIRELCSRMNAAQGAVYVANGTMLELVCGYALPYEKRSTTYAFGEGLVGRVAAENSPLYIDQLPEGYITVFSGLGMSSPTSLMIVPAALENEVKAVIEIALFEPVTTSTKEVIEKIGVALATGI